MIGLFILNKKEENPFRLKDLKYFRTELYILVYNILEITIDMDYEQRNIEWVCILENEAYKLCFMDVKFLVSFFCKHP